VRAGIALGFLLAFAAGGAAQARDSDPVAVGRYHLRKANQLAGEDHCHSAIHEYTLAYEKLQDPFVLFNRAECYRRLGQAEKAVSDYRAFLEAVPAAPNRADIEAKISALAALTEPKPPAAPPSEPAATAPPLPPPPPPAFTEPPHQPVVVLPPVEIQPPAREPPAPARPAAVLSQPVPAASATETDSAGGHGGHLWLWIAIGAAVVGGAAGAYVALRSPSTTPPPTDLGNYKF
jgi:tetratricopeptide (TPR) repeat protein